jgi:hypothetical protein
MARRGRKTKSSQSQEVTVQKRGRGRPKSSTGNLKVPSLTKEVNDLNVACKEVFKTLTPQPYVYVGMDQRSTKSIGNYETFVFGFSLTIPVEYEKGDDISYDETREKLKKKYESVSSFLSSLMREVEERVEAAQNLAPSIQPKVNVLTDSKTPPETTTNGPTSVTLT